MEKLWKYGIRPTLSDKIVGVPKTGDRIHQPKSNNHNGTQHTGKVWDEKAVESSVSKI